MLSFLWLNWQILTYLVSSRGGSTKTNLSRFVNASVVLTMSSKNPSPSLGCIVCTQRRSLTCILCTCRESAVEFSIGLSLIMPPLAFL